MAGLIEENLIKIIEKDDVKAFNELTEKAQCGGYRLGRFPVLSLLYLYKSRKILSAYEERFLKITAWEPLREPVSVWKKFSEKAGKCLRLYSNEIVTPLEMLLILDRTRRLKRAYPLTKPSSAVKERLQAIYSIKYSLNIKFEGNGIIPDRRPLSYREKKRIATICVSAFLAAAIIVAAPVTTVALVPKRADGEVMKLSHIDFGARKVYTLKRDITIPENYTVEKMNCTIVGEGNKLIFGKGASFGEFGGKMRDVEIVSSGSPIFTTVTERAVISDVTVNITADMEINGSTALIAVTNYGTIDGVTVNVSGNVSALSGSADIIVGGMVLNNSGRNAVTQPYGIINDCTVNYSDFSLKGEVKANASFGGIVGVNNGAVLGCTVTGNITADTFDLGGVCALNEYGLSGNTNAANLTQVSEDEGWSPIVSGIVIENGYVAEYCKNTGNLSVEGSGSAICGGIAARTYGTIDYCVSVGNITAAAETVYAGGIFGRSEIAGYMYWGIADFCISEGRIEVAATKTSCVGGIAGFVQEGLFVDSDNQPVGYFGGGVNNCIFAGEWLGAAAHFGSIVGVCGANIYGTNSYIYGAEEYYNFSGNRYAAGSFTAFGATVTVDDEDRETFVFPVEDKGATADADIRNSKAYRDILGAFGG